MSINPVRYPGGKGRKSIVDRVLDVLPDGILDGRTWVEPFCGGCGLGLSLIERGIITHAVFNDGDPRISVMWRVIAYDTDRMIGRIEKTPIDMTLFRQSKRIANDEDADTFERGFATYVLNRCCRSGYIDGGVIGGNEQDGKYKLDCRFNKETLRKDIRRIGELADDGVIEFTKGGDAISLIDGISEHARRDDDEVFVYVDPPYVVKGASCYRKGVDHQELAHTMRRADVAGIRWLVSYDECDEVRELYDGYRTEPLEITYSNNTRTRGKTQELLITNG